MGGGFSSLQVLAQALGEWGWLSRSGDTRGWRTTGLFGSPDFGVLEPAPSNRDTEEAAGQVWGLEWRSGGWSSQREWGRGGCRI